MELLIATLALIALSLAAIRWGADSRSTLHSREEQLSVNNMTWHTEHRRRIEAPQTRAAERRATAVIVLADQPERSHARAA